MSDKHTQGIYHKYDVQRTDGRDMTGEKHEDCALFVLDLTHDPHALPAIRAYAESCRADCPALAADLDRLYPPPPIIPIVPSAVEMLPSVVYDAIVRALQRGEATRKIMNQFKVSRMCVTSIRNAIAANQKEQG